MSMSQSDREDLIAKFIDITGANDDRAIFFLESATFDLNAAVQAYIDADPMHEENETLNSSSDEDYGPNANYQQATTQQPEASQQSSQQPPQPHRTNRDRRQIGTIASFQEKDDSNDEQQAYYAGGSEHGGGQQIIGPTKKKSSNVVKDIFDSARQHGAEDAQASAPQAETKRLKSFGGTGYKLGDSETQGESSMYTNPSQPEATMENRETAVVLKMWRNGFSIDDGPLREYADPANKPFLDSIKRGQIPQELIGRGRGTIDLSMEDHRNDEYVKPKPKQVPFMGEGHRLGNPVAEVTTSKPPASLSSTASAPVTVKVDELQPTTQIQIRVADGRRLVGKFNHTHRISDVRNFIVQSHPEYAGTNFVLMTNFPNQELTNESLTLTDAKLLNAVLVQRMK